MPDNCAYMINALQSQVQGLETKLAIESQIRHDADVAQHRADQRLEELIRRLTERLDNLERKVRP